MKYTIKDLDKIMEENDGNLYLSGVVKLPKNLKVNGIFFIKSFSYEISELPKNLEVGGSFDITHEMIKKLPESLKV